MRGKVLFCLIVLCLLIVPTVSADTLFTYISYNGEFTRETDGTWDEVHDGEGESYAHTTQESIAVATTTDNLWSRIRRHGYVSDTSGIAANYSSYNVTNATLYVYRSGSANTFASSPDISITAFTPTNYTGLQTSDYSQFGNKIGDDVDTLTVGDYTGIPISNLTYINGSGYTGLGVQVDWDAEDTPPEWQDTKAMSWTIYFIEATGTVKDPYLVIEYEAAAGGDPPVASFTKNQTAGVAPLPVGFTDTSTNTPDEWHWWVNNVTGNDTPYEFASTQNPSITLGVGNWSFALNASNAYGWNITPGYDWVNVSAEAGDTTPPASITGLANITTCNSINWTWIDSESEDADQVMIWKDNVFLHNVSANQTYDLWEGLEELTEYTFSSHTCDLIGNCNETWVNLSSITGTCATPTPTPTPTPAPTPSGDAGFDGYAHFNFTAWNNTPMDDWNWSVNSIFVGNGTDSFLNTWLLWGQIHNITLFISNTTDNFTISQYYNLHNITPTITPTQTAWIPDINPSTEVNYSPENLFNYWWIPALILVIWLLFRRS